MALAFLSCRVGVDLLVNGFGMNAEVPSYDSASGCLLTLTDVPSP